jgi:glucose 1-dehydrogenase
MRAITVDPTIRDSLALEHLPEPPADDGAILVQTLALGLCGTDREIVAAHCGTAPSGTRRLVLGHESLGRVLEAPAGSHKPGDLVVGIVRRPDPVPCPACAAGQWDMCRNGRYTEHGIKGLHGFGAERFRLDPDFAVRVDPSLGVLGVLVEPASVVAKAWMHAEATGKRSVWAPRTALITGAGPIGLLAALLGRQRGLDVHVFDRHADGPKPQLARAIGAHYRTGDLDDLQALLPDIVMECTGAPAVIHRLFGHVAPASIHCLLGVSGQGATFDVDIGTWNRELVLNNGLMFGSVNANRAHYQAAARALEESERQFPGWLARLVTRRVPLERWQEAFRPMPDDIKVVIDFAPAASGA